MLLLLPGYHRKNPLLPYRPLFRSFWAFACAGGQALARYLLDHPEVVRGKRVLDFAAGSGLQGIAAMLAGAASVEAADLDAFACAACRLKAATTGVQIAATGDDTGGRQTAGGDGGQPGAVRYTPGPDT